MIEIDGIPRRIRKDHMISVERAMLDVVGEIEKLGAHVLLTEAINLIHVARTSVADYVDLNIEKMVEKCRDK